MVDVFGSAVGERCGRRHAVVRPRDDGTAPRAAWVCLLPVSDHDGVQVLTDAAGSLGARHDGRSPAAMVSISLLLAISADRTAHCRLCNTLRTPDHGRRRL